MIHIYYGDGKGKTTAALGLALRAAGCGHKVVVIQFLKDWNCGELNSLELLPNVTVFRGKAPGGVFVRDMNDEQKAETKKLHDGNLKKALDLCRLGECGLLVLDEAIDAYGLNLLDATLFKGLLTDKHVPLEIVVTGHRPEEWILGLADYATEMVKRKHPYDLGVTARRGVEF